MEEEKKRIKRLRILVVALIIVFFGLAIAFAIISMRKTVMLDILVAPLSAKTEINGKEYKNGKYEFEPGEISVKITRDDFKEQEFTMELVVGEEAKLYTYLIPLDGTMDWYLSHEEDQMILNTIGGEQAVRESQEYSKNYPISTILPIIYADYDEEWNYTEYRIDGGDFDECSKDFCVKITDVTGGNEDAAMQKIRDSGFNPDDYEVIYSYEPMTPLR